MEKRLSLSFEQGSSFRIKTFQFVKQMQNEERVGIFEMNIEAAAGFLFLLRVH